MILILSHADDVHAQAVVAELDRLRAPSVVLDLGRLPVHARLALRFGGARTATLRDGAGGVDFGAVRAAWWRRPQPFQPDAALHGDPWRFALGECQDVCDGLWQTLGAFWVNNPARDEVAHRKVWQLRVAEAAGLDVPDTLVTNSPDEAAAFLDARPPGTVVFKSFTAFETAWRETRLVREAERAALAAVRHAPVCFQEYVPGVDVRATVVGDRVFAAELDARASAYPVDFRMDMAGVRIAPTVLPPDVERRLLAVVRRLGLEYGAADFRRTDAGRYVFLEVNPAGQWLFVEHATGQPIARALAEHLAAGVPAVAPAPPGDGAASEVVLGAQDGR